MAARAERNIVGNRYGSISYSTSPLHRPNGYIQPSHRSRSGGRGRARPNQTNPGNSNSSDDSIDVRFVPPAHIAQHWGEDWVPTFTRDSQRQSEPSEPHSDAYLSGMPPKKRRCVQQSRPSTTLTALISESVGAVAREEIIEEPPQDQLRVVFCEQVRVSVRSRAAASSDYEPQRHTATINFLKKSSNVETPKAPESKSDSE